MNVKSSERGWQTGQPKAVFINKVSFKHSHAHLYLWSPVVIMLQWQSSVVTAEPVQPTKTTVFTIQHFLRESLPIPCPLGSSSHRGMASRRSSSSSGAIKNSIPTWSDNRQRRSSGAKPQALVLQVYLTNKLMRKRHWAQSISKNTR